MTITKEKSPQGDDLLASPASVFSIGACYSISDYTTQQNLCQEKSKIFFDFSEQTEIDVKFVPKRKLSDLLSACYDRLGFSSKSKRVSDCGTLLEFAHEIGIDGSVSDVGKLHNANFCKDRLCPLCAWRRSYKIFAQVSQIMELIGSQYSFLFLTLTVPSVPSEMLTSTISRIIKAWDLLSKRKVFKTSIKGFFRALEITRNNDMSSKSYGLYHPHFHCVLAVPHSYFTSRAYISRDEWLFLWQSCYNDFNITQVDIRLARDKFSDVGSDAVNKLSSAVAEIAKYSVKPSDYLYPDDVVLTDDVVKTLSEALSGRRLTSFGGCFKEAYQKLQLDDAENGDLVHIDSQLNPSLAWLIVRYGWSAGAYKMTDKYIRYSQGGE